MKNMVTAIDFGTKKIVTLVAENGSNQRCDIAGTGVEEYDGYQNSTWNNPGALHGNIAASIQKAQDQSKRRIRDIYVGVPGEFSRVYTVEHKLELDGASPRVAPKDVEKLLEQAQKDLLDVPGVLIHRGPAWFMVDDGKKTLEPVGTSGHVLKALVSFVMADQFFINEIRAKMDAMNIRINMFFSATTGEALLYLPNEERDRTAFLIDVGYLNTDVMAVEGDAVVFQQTIPLGGAHIAMDLAYGFKVNMNVAEEIKRAFSFSVSVGNTTIDVTAEGRTISYERDKVANILEPRVDEIAEAIKACIDDSGIKLGNWSSIYLTGGGLAFNRGGREYLSARLGHPVRDIPKKTSKLNSPIYSSTLGLINLILDTIELQASTGGIAEFFRSLFGN